MKLNDVLYYDVETATYEEGVVDPSRDRLRFVGFRHPSNGKKIIFEYPAQKQMIQNVLSSYKYVSGHNINKRKNKGMDMGYDNEVMVRHGFRFKTMNKQKIISLDTQEIAEKRLKAMMNLDFGMGQMSLDYLTKFFKLVDEDTMKGTFDYNLLRKPSLTPSERKELYDYLNRDLDSGWALFKFFFEFFEGFQHYMKTSDILNGSWLLGSSGTVAYKCICNVASLPEEYSDNKNHSKKQYEGGYVALPYMDKSEGSIYCIDFASLYPHMYMGGNLYSPVNEHDTEIYDSSNAGIYGETADAIQGKYKRERGKIETCIHDLYNDRLKATEIVTYYKTKKAVMPLSDDEEHEYITNTRKRLAIKIIINTMYGISGSEKFTSVYNLMTASDCTRMSRRSIKNAGAILTEHGYKLLYGDTDSWYVLDPFNDYERLLALCVKITEIQKASFNIRTDTHNFEIEDAIQRMYFFKNDLGEYNKKHYIYVLKDGKVKLKGGRIVKGDCSPLAKECFNKYIIPKIEKGEHIITSPENLMESMMYVAKERPELVTKRFRVKPMSEYKGSNGKEPTSIQYQVSKMYGVGEHHLVCNKYFGAGKGVKYCSMTEIKDLYGDDWLQAVNYTKYVNDLKHFVQPQERKRISKL